MKKTKSLLFGFLLALGGGALAATFNTFTPATGILKGNASSPVTTAALSTDVISLWTGTCNASTFLRGDGSCQSAATPPGGADTQVQFNDGGVFGGSGNFTWNDVSLQITTPAGLNPGVIVAGNAAGAPIYEWQDLSVAANGRRWWMLASGSFQLFAVDDAGTPGNIGLQVDRQAGTTTITRSQLVAGPTARSLGISSTGEVRVNGSVGTTGQVLTSGGAAADATWTTLVGVPGGADTQVQFNNAGAFGGDAGLTYNAGTDTLTAGILSANTGVLTPVVQSLSALSLSATGANDVSISTNGSGRLSIGSGGDWLVGGTVGSAGQIFTSNGVGANPSWQNSAGCTFANPTALLGLTAINGVATTCMRSDAAPALNQGIIPTWTDLHTFSASARVTGTTASWRVNTTGAAANEGNWLLRGNNAGVFTISTATDAAPANSAFEAVTIERTGTTVDQVVLGASRVDVTRQSPAGQPVDFFINDQASSADERLWRFRGNGAGQLQVGAVNDALSVANNFVITERTGAAVDSVSLVARTVSAGVAPLSSTSIQMCGSGAGYAVIGSNIVCTSSASTYNYGVNDTAWLMDFSGTSLNGWSWRNASSGTAGNPISFTTRATLTSGGVLNATGGVQVNGVDVCQSNGTNCRSGGAQRIARASLLDVGSSCAASNSSGITSSSPSAGGCSVDYTAAGFSSAPVCTLSVQDGTPWGIGRMQPPTTTSVFVTIRDTANSLINTLDGYLICMGT